MKDHHQAVVGKKAPRFKASAWTGINFKEISIEDYIGKYILLKFYTKSFTEDSITQLEEFNSNFESFKKLSKQLMNIYK